MDGGLADSLDSLDEYQNEGDVPCSGETVDITSRKDLEPGMLAELIDCLSPKEDHLLHDQNFESSKCQDSLYQSSENNETYDSITANK